MSCSVSVSFSYSKSKIIHTNNKLKTFSQRIGLKKEATTLTTKKKIDSQYITLNHFFVILICIFILIEI